jgi:DNA polymerase III subunit epsilon
MTIAFEPFLQILRGLRGRREENFGTGRIQNAQQLAYLRNMQREISKYDPMNIPLKEMPFLLFDMETTGFRPEKGDSILSIGAVKMRGADILEETFYSLVQSEKEVPLEITELTNITTEMIREARPFSDIYMEFLEFKSDSILVAHHSVHERTFLEYAGTKLLRTPFKHRIIDTSFLFKVVNPTLTLTALEDLCVFHKIEVKDRHHALADAKMTAKLWSLYIEMAVQLGYETLGDVYWKFSQMT